MNPHQELLRRLPSVDRLLNEPALANLASGCPHCFLAEAARESVEELRRCVLDDAAAVAPEAFEPAALAQKAARLALGRLAPSLRHVINATGTLLHTNLGRAPLPNAALQAINEVSRSYSNLEYDLDTGRRGHRFRHVEELLCRLTGAEAATVVNNNAGATFLALTALAAGHEAVVSRGELVEIGGSFRIPDVMAAGGVTLREVGTTNKTHPRDYRDAIGEQTALLLKVHTSNFRILGFTAGVSSAELAQIGSDYGIPVMEDLGSGMLFDLAAYGLPREPTVAEAVASGLDVVTFSGDKLLGGPQAGLIVGRRAQIEKIRQHPMARALRIDKLSLAALEATLRLYLERDTALREIPVLRMLAAPAEELRERCQQFVHRLQEQVRTEIESQTIQASSTVGGGALPLTELPGHAVALRPRTFSVDQLAQRLRLNLPPIIGQVQDDRLLIHLRTVDPDEEQSLILALKNALNQDL